MALAFKRAVANAEASSYYKGDMEDFFDAFKLPKKYRITVDWELVKEQQGQAKISGNSDAKDEPAPVVIAYIIGNNRLTFTFKDAISRLLKDDMGKEAFVETFDAVIVRPKIAAANGCIVSKEGKNLLFNVDISLSGYDHQNVDRAIEPAKLAKDIEAML